MKWVEPVTKPNHSLASVENDDTLNKSFDKTLLDTIIVEQIDKISDGKISEGFDELHNNNSVPLVIETNLSPDYNSDSLMLNHIEENFSEALDKLKLSQEQFLHNQVISVIIKQSEILSDHKKLLDSVCSKIDSLQSLQRSSSPSKSSQEPHNKKLESELGKLKQRINVLESEKMEITYQKQKSKSEYEMRIAILESENEYLQQNIDKYKRQVSNSLKDNSQDEQIMIDKLSKKNDEIQNLESSNLSLKKKLVDYEEEILSLKIHNSRASIVLHDSTVHRTGEKNDVVESDPIVSKKTKSQPIMVENENPIVVKDKKEVLLVGTSIMRNIDPRFLSKEYFTTKLTAYTVEEASTVISNSKAEPDVVIFHSLTNNLKTEDPADCVKKLSDVVHDTFLKWPLSHVMISLETPRADNPDLNNKVHVANGLIRCSFYKKDRVSIIDHSNLASQGQPIIRFFNVNDKSHLSAQGTSLLASNVRSSLDKHFGIKDDKGDNFQESGGRGRRQYGPRGGFYPRRARYPGPQSGYFRNYRPF